MTAENDDAPAGRPRRLGQQRNDAGANNTTPGEHSNSRRAPPAFQMYAASRLADRDFRSAAAVERGVLHSMELECWVNGTVPRDQRSLARVLGLDAAEVQAGLTQRVLRHFEARHDDLEGEVLVHPELDAYRAKLDVQYENRAESGRRNIARINERKKAGVSSNDSTSNPPDVSTSPKYSTDQYSQKQSIDDADIHEEHREFVRELAGEPEFMQEKKLAARQKPGIRS